MAVQTITYANKSYINQNSSIADTNKVNDTDMNEIKSVVNNNATILEGLTGTLLWTNSNPSSLLPSDTNITLSESDSNYDILGVFFKTANDGTDVEYSQTLVGNGFNIGAIGFEGAGLRRRIVRNSDTSYTIKAYNGETLADSGTGKYIIPIYIIGFKTGVFE